MPWRVVVAVVVVAVAAEQLPAGGVPGGHVDGVYVYQQEGRMTTKCRPDEHVCDSCHAG